LSVAGLMPMTASPLPCSRPSSRLAAMPALSSVIGLQPRRQPTGQADRAAKARHHRALVRDQHQVLQATQLADRRHHFGRQAGRERGQRRAIGRVAQQPVAQVAHRQVAHRCEGGGVVVIDDQPRDFIVLVGHHRFVQEGRQRQVGQRQRREPMVCA